MAEVEKATLPIPSELYPHTLATVYLCGTARPSKLKQEMLQRAVSTGFYMGGGRPRGLPPLRLAAACAAPSEDGSPRPVEDASPRAKCDSSVHANSASLSPAATSMRKSPNSIRRRSPELLTARLVSMLRCDRDRRGGALKVVTGPSRELPKTGTSTSNPIRCRGRASVSSASATSRVESESLERTSLIGSVMPVAVSRSSDPMVGGDLTSDASPTAGRPFGPHDTVAPEPRPPSLPASPPTFAQPSPLDTTFLPVSPVARLSKSTPCREAACAPGASHSALERDATLRADSSPFFRKEIGVQTDGVAPRVLPVSVHADFSGWTCVHLTKKMTWQEQYLQTATHRFPGALEHTMLERQNGPGRPQLLRSSIRGFGSSSQRGTENLCRAFADHTAQGVPQSAACEFGCAF